jgi:putative ABC transport system permease protein
MRLSNIVHLYLVRLKARVVLVQEIFAVLGIAVGVALLFASQVASTSLSGSVVELTNGVIGQSKYQLKARGAEGFSEKLFGEVQRLPGVRAAVPVLEQQASVTGRSGTRAVDLIATDPRFVSLTGPLLLHFSAKQLAHQQALALPAPIAQAVGAGPLETVKLQLGGSAITALVAVELTSRSIGQLVHSPVVIAPLAYAQKLAGMQGKITRIFVQPQPGKDREVQAGLSRLAGNSLNVQPADYDAVLFNQAAGPINQSTGTFAAICALVGFMFAYCSMLLTIDLRRGLIRELRRAGATRWGTVRILLFDAFVLGALASVLGLAFGEAFLTLAFPASSGYLSFAFPVGNHQIVTNQSVEISIAVGMLAATVGVMSPARDLWTRAARRAASSETRDLSRRSLGLLTAGLACLGATTLILVLAPQSAVLGIVALLCALLLLLPVLTDLTTFIFDRLQRPVGSAATEIAVLEVRSLKTRVRSTAIASTAAIAVFASVTIQGSHASLQGGLDRLVHQLSSVANLWVLPSGEQDLLATDPLTGIKPLNLEHLPGVRYVGLYRASFLEYSGRRVWVLAPPGTANSPLPPSQVVTGNLAVATARLRAGGWAVLSQGLAKERHLRIGQVFTLPAPRPITLRLAATTTNLGWPPGAVILSSADYVRAWPNTPPSAYNIVLDPGASGSQVRSEIRRAIGPGTALSVQSTREREQKQVAASHDGLARLTQIAVLVLVAGVLATATSMSAVVWQRRRRFARMKVQGYATETLWFALLWESVLLFGGGCVVGAGLGIYGQLLLSHALLTVTGFPVIFSIGALLALGCFALVTVIAAAIVGVPGYRAANVRPYPYS